MFFRDSGKEEGGFFLGEVKIGTVVILIGISLIILSYYRLPPSIKEFVGMDMEMHFTEHYHEVLVVLDKTFRYIFDQLNTKYKSEIEAVRKQFPFEDLRYPTFSANETSTGIEGMCKVFTFKEAVELLRKEGPGVAKEKVGIVCSNVGDGIFLLL